MIAGNVLEILAALVLAVCVLKAVCYPKLYQDELSNPNSHSSFFAGCMAVSNIAAFLQPLSENQALFLWYFSISMHISQLFTYASKQMQRFRSRARLGLPPWPLINPSMAVPIVGIVLIASNGSVFGHTTEGIRKSVFWYALMQCFALTVLFSIRMFVVGKSQKIARSDLPLFAIFTAPPALLVIASTNCTKVPNQNTLILILFCFQMSVLFLFFGFITMNRDGYLSLTFSPSWSAMTFPSVANTLAV
ncbi:unnamed protein product, partial [Heterosigma akashiwo]